VWKETQSIMNKHAGGRPAKSGARRELKTFRLVPDAIERLDRLARERGGSTSDVLNELLMDGRPLEADAPRAPRLEVLPGPTEADLGAANVTRFRVLPGKARPDAAEDAGRVQHELERLRDALGGVLGEIECLMTEQLAEGQEATKKGARASDPYGQGFRDGMLEALETAYALLQTELLISDS
jgi:hypothetical protein